LLQATRILRRSDDEVRRVLVSGYTGLGHFVLKSVVIKQIEEVFPACRVTIIAGNSFGTEHILSDYPTLILEQDAPAWRKAVFFWRLRRQRFDAVVLPCDASPKFLMWGVILADIPGRVGHVFDGLYLPPYYYTHRVPVKRTGPRSEIDMNLDLVEALLGRPFQRRYRPSADVDLSSEALSRFGLQPDQYICVQPGAANGQPTTKRWLEQHFRQLIERLLQEHPGVAVVPVGDAGDAAISRRVCGGLVHERLIDTTGKVDLVEAKSLIAHCRLLICHDSGLLHLGNALGRSVIALYGPSEPDQYALRLTTCHVLQERCDCPPLGLFPGMGEPTEAEAYARCPVPKCMERLSVDRVYEKCMELLPM
jgi:ADP-heptose:LPS heptosyltransferase